MGACSRDEARAFHEALFDFVTTVLARCNVALRRGALEQIINEVGPFPRPLSLRANSRAAEEAGANESTRATRDEAWVEWAPVLRLLPLLLSLIASPTRAASIEVATGKIDAHEKVQWAPSATSKSTAQASRRSAASGRSASGNSSRARGNAVGEGEWDYDGLGRLKRRVTSGTPSTEYVYAYELGEKTLKVTETCVGTPHRVVTTYEDGLLVSRTTAAEINGVPSVDTETYAYDAGRLVARVDAEITQRVSYAPGTGYVTGVATRDGVQAVYGHDESGRVKSVTGSYGETTTHRFDALSRQTGAEYGAAGSSAGQVAEASGAPSRTQVGLHEYETKWNGLRATRRSVDGGGGVDEETTYDSAGRVVSRLDAVTGLEDSYEYVDVLGRVTKHTRVVPQVADASVLVETFAYADSDGGTTVAASRNFGDHLETETREYDAQGRLLRETAPVTGQVAESTTSYEYDGEGRVTKVTHPDGERKLTYDGRGKLLTETDEDKKVTTYVWDTHGRLKKKVGPRPGQETAYEYDDLSRLERRTEAGVSGAWTYEYPSAGVVQETTPSAHVTRTTLDGQGRWVKRVTQLAGGDFEETRRFDGPEVSNLTQSEGSWLKETAVVFDGRFRATETNENWSAGAESYSYNTKTSWAGRRASLTHVWSEGIAPNPHRIEVDGLGNVIKQELGAYTDEYGTDGAGRRVRQVLAATTPRSFAWGADGRLKQETFGAETTHYEYTPRGQLRTLLTPDGRTTTRTYTKRGQVELETYGIGVDVTSTKYAYDEAGALAEKHEGYGTADVAVWQYGRSPRGDLASVLEPGSASGLLFVYEYWPEGQLKKVTPPSGSARATDEYAYDALGRETLKKRGAEPWATTWSNGVSTQMTPMANRLTTLFDGRGRQRRVEYSPGATQSNDMSAKTFAWDGLDAVTQTSETRGSLNTASSFVYDGSRLLRSVARDGDVVSYTYNAARNVEDEVARGTTVTRGYDVNQRLSQVTGAWGGTEVTWEPGGQRLKTLTDNLVDETYGYDNRGRLQSVISTHGGAALASTTYTHDARGNKLTETQNGGQRLFAYDLADRLTAWTEWGGSAVALKLRADGSRDEERQYMAPSSPTVPPGFDSAPGYTETAHRKYGYDNTGALLSISTLLPDGGVAVTAGYVHDKDGRRISEPGGTGQWNVESRLTQQNVDATATVSATTYDSMGLRRTVASTVGGVAQPTRSYSWAGGNGEAEVAADNARVVSVAGVIIAQGSVRLAHDGVGSVIARVDSSGTLGAHRYSAWGEFEPGTTQVPPPEARHAGNALDGQKRKYAGQRWGDVVTGTWLSEDPLRGDLMRPSTMNPWLAVNGNPMRYVDPDGRAPSDNCDAYSGEQYEQCLSKVRTHSDMPNASAVLYGPTSPTWFKAWMGVSMGGSAGLAMGGVCTMAPGVCAKLGLAAMGGALTSGAPTVVAVGEQVGSCIGPNANAFGCSGNASFGVMATLVGMGGAKTPSWWENPFEFGPMIEKSVTESVAEFAAETANGQNVPAIFGEVESAAVADFVMVPSARKPRVDVTDRFRIKRSKNAVQLRYGTPSFHGLEVSVRDGIAGFDIRAGGDAQTMGSGTDMMLSAMRRLEKEGVVVEKLRGYWFSESDSVNAAEYRANIEAGMSLVDAAANTWTGRLFKSWGYAPETVNSTSSTTSVIFGKKP